MYPDVVVELIPIFIPARIVELIITLRPAVIVMPPSAELTAAEIVKSPVVPEDVNVTLPYPPALTAPLIPNVAEVA
jgi:hypothetical protein